MKGVFIPKILVLVLILEIVISQLGFLYLYLHHDKLEDGDVVLVYSDGLQKPLFSSEGLKFIREKKAISKIHWF